MDNANSYFYPMKVEEEIDQFIGSLALSKRSDFLSLHKFMLSIMPGTKLGFLNGKNSENKLVSNPNIGYGYQTIKYADGKTRDFY